MANIINHNDRVERRIHRWKNSPARKVHKVVDKVVRSGGGIEKENLLLFIKTECRVKSPVGTLSSLKTDAGNSYGKAFIEEDGLIKLDPEKAEMILRTWQGE